MEYEHWNTSIDHILTLTDYVASVIWVVGFVYYYCFSHSVSCGNPVSCPPRLLLIQCNKTTVCCSLGLYRDLLEDQVREYVESYAASFDLKRHVRFGHAVTSVRPTASGGWEITFTIATTSSKGFTDEDDVQHQHETFDRCIIASGIFSEPYFPPPTVVGGVTDAVRAGWATHGGAYKEPAFCVGKTALVVGCAFSGAEIASGGSEMSAWVAHLRNVS